MEYKRQGRKEDIKAQERKEKKKKAGRLKNSNPERKKEEEKVTQNWEGCSRHMNVVRLSAPRKISGTHCNHHAAFPGLRSQNVYQIVGEQENLNSAG
jgi:hypothetical protein